MRTTISKKIAPPQVLDILPDTLQDEQLLKDFLNYFGDKLDFAKIEISPLENGGIMIKPMPNTHGLLR